MVICYIQMLMNVMQTPVTMTVRTLTEVTHVRAGLALYWIPGMPIPVLVGTHHWASLPTDIKETSS